uniref:WD_REPEATS_REGION domain-containing protein n=1 Tax=Strongyloides stercoralis TaxID=6248 RepID=A0A0K0ETB1_STRER
MDHLFYSNKKNRRTSVSSLTNLVKNFIDKKKETFSSNNKRKPNNMFNLDIKTIGNRYIPLRKSEEELESSWLNNGFDSVIFNNNNFQNNNNRKKEKKNKIINLNGKEILNLILRNEILNENIGSLTKYTDYSITHNSTLFLNPKPQTFLTYCKGISINNIINNRIKNNLATLFYPFSEATNNLLSMKMKYSLKVIDRPTRIIQTKLYSNNYNYNPLDWSSNDILAFITEGSVYFKNYDRASYFKYSTENDYSLVKFNLSGNKLFLGSRYGSNSIVNIMEGIIRFDKICCNVNVTDAEWLDDNILIISATTGYIFFYDTRDFNQLIATLYNCKCSIRKIKLNLRKNYLATACTCNIVNVWCMNERTIFEKFKKHNDTINSLEWSNYSNSILVSGGDCQRLYIRNVNIPENIKYIDTGHSIKNIHWIKDTTNIITTHNLPTSNAVIWNSLKSNPIAIISNNQEPTTYSIVSPNKNILGTASSNGRIFFWDLAEHFQMERDLKRSKLNPYYFVR